MLFRKHSDICSSEITPEKLYENRRQFLISASSALAASCLATLPLSACAATVPQGVALQPSKYDSKERMNSYSDVTTYNNYYEFGSDKSDPSRNSRLFAPTPWTVDVGGLVKKPAKFAIDDLLRGVTMEDRIYRMRCVEGWSMVIPWHGFPLATLIPRLEPLPSAKFVEFKTLLDPNRMPGQRRSVLNWPYTEGLRMDEAMHELTLLAVGVYGKGGPVQNGAPLRLVVPWKYGFKGIKGIVRINFTDRMPVSSWMESYPSAYGFYANVNPAVNHPQWSQANERRLGEFFRRRTLIFNGYGEYVAGMYSGLDLRKNY